MAETKKAPAKAKKTSPASAEAENVAVAPEPLVSEAEVIEPEADDLGEGTLDRQGTFSYDNQDIIISAMDKLSELPEMTPEFTVAKSSLRKVEEVRRDDAFYIDPKLIRVDEEENPRRRYYKTLALWQEFKASIASEGVRMPVQVYVKRTKHGDVDVLTYHLAQGFRRMRAIRELLAEDPGNLNLKQVPFEKVEYNREKILADHILLNNGLDLEDWEKARIVEQYKAWNYKTADIARVTHLSTDKVLYLLEFTRKASKKLRELVESGAFKMTNAVNFARRNPDPVKQTQKLVEVEEQREQLIAENEAQALAAQAQPPVAPEPEPIAEAPAETAPKKKTQKTGKAAPEPTPVAESSPEVTPPAAVAVVAPVAPPAPLRKIPRLDQMLDDLKVVNVDREADKLLSFLDREQEQFADQIDVRKVDLFKGVMRMLREGKSATDILKTHFML